MAGLRDVCKEVGLSPIVTESGQRVNALSLVEALFDKILEIANSGEIVRIKNFGTFRVKLNKGRTLKTPLMEGGEITYPDMMLLKFKQSLSSKKSINVTELPKKSKKSKGKDEKSKSKDEKMSKKEGKVKKPKVVDNPPEMDTDSSDEAPKKSKDKKSKKKVPNKQ